MEVEMIHKSILQTHYSSFSDKNIKKNITEIVDHMSMPIINLQSNIYHNKSNMRLKKNRKVSFLPNLIEVGNFVLICYGSIALSYLNKTYFLT